jgi:glycosyltransferase involved in cell wall biosynthesis
VRKLSVILPVFNPGAYLRLAVESVLSIREESMETIVVDDGSTDGSLGTIRDLPVQVIRQENRGESVARNTGVRAAQGEFFTFLDGDDLLVSKSVKPRRDYLEEHPHEWAVGGLPSKLIDESGKCLAEVYESMSQKLSFPLRWSLHDYQIGKFFPVSCSLYLYRREVFDRIGLFDESLERSPDCEFHFRLLSKTEIPILDIPTFDRRIHSTNLSFERDERGRYAFKPEIVRSVCAINRKYGVPAHSIIPWEADYL